MAFVHTCSQYRSSSCLGGLADWLAIYVCVHSCVSICVCCFCSLSFVFIVSTLFDLFSSLPSILSFWACVCLVVSSFPFAISYKRWCFFCSFFFDWVRLWVFLRLVGGAFLSFIILVNTTGSSRSNKKFLVGVGSMGGSLSIVPSLAEFVLALGVLCCVSQPSTAHRG